MATHVEEAEEEVFAVEEYIIIIKAIGEANINIHQMKKIPQVVCFNCDQPGHKAFNCPEKRSEERKQARDDSFNKNRSVGKSFGAVSSSLYLMVQRPSHMLADSGATHHMTEQRSFFSTYRGIPPGTWKVNGFGGVVLSALGIDIIEVTALVNGEPVHGKLHEVLHVPGIGRRKVGSLFSVGCATAAGMDVLFSDTKAALSVNQNTVIFVKEFVKRCIT